MNQNYSQWGGGWFYTRILFSIVAITNNFPRFFMADDLFGSSIMRFQNGWFALSKIYEINTHEALACCVLSIVGLLGVARGGKTFHIGLVLWFITNSIYLTSEALNVKAYDRLLIFIGLGLFFSPAYKKNLFTTYISPYSRYIMLVIFSSLYLSTGLLKLLYEPSWFTGEALSYHLNHRWHGGTSFSLLLSTQWLIMLVLSITTLLFEISAGVFLWLKRLNPLLITLGLFFHLGIEAIMHVGSFSLVALSAYPILLHPDHLLSIHKIMIQKIR